MSYHTRPAFTLVELLVVIAIVGVLTGTFAVALRSGDRGPAVQAAQASLSGLVSSARAQAALNSADATVIIWADHTDIENYLHRAAIAVKVDTDGNGTLDAYNIRGDAIDLPRGIFFVPENNNGTGLPAKLEIPGDWTDLTLTESQATAHGTTSAASMRFRRYEEDSSPKWQPDPDAPATYYESVVFNSYGQLANNTVQYLAVAPGEIEPGPGDADKGIVFQNPDALRGLKLNAYGIPFLLNDKKAFEP